LGNTQQLRAWESTKRFVVVLAGTQAGKTAFGPAWLLGEIQRRGPGDYMIVTPTFPLLELKALPTFRKLFESSSNWEAIRAIPSGSSRFRRPGADTSSAKTAGRQARKQ
jgi:hypothetical protein